MNCKKGLYYWPDRILFELNRKSLVEIISTSKDILSILKKIRSMQQRITSLWSGLLSFGRDEDAAEHRIQQAPGQAEDLLGTNIVEEYEKSKWSRVSSI